MVELDNFYLEKFSFENRIHINVINSLDQDEASKKYLGSLERFVQRTKYAHEENFVDEFYIVFYNNTPIGILVLNKIDDRYEISIGILKEYRKEHLAPLLLQEFSEKCFENDIDLDKLYVKIESSNINSIKAAKLVGYELEEKNYYSIKR